MIIEDNDVELFIESKKKKNKGIKIIIIVFVLLLVSVSLVYASFSETTEEVKIVKKWSGQEQTQVDPQHAFSNNMYMLGDSIYFSETEQIDYRGYMIEHIRSYDKDFKEIKKLDLEQASYSTYFQQLGDEMYYANVYCDYPDSDRYGYCHVYFYKTNENLEILNSFVDWERGRYYRAFNTDSVDTTVENILAKDESGNLYIYTGYDKNSDSYYAGIIDDEFKRVEYYKLSNEEMETMFPDIKKMQDRENFYLEAYEETRYATGGQNTETAYAPLYNFTSITTLKNGNELYLGQTVDNDSVAYFEIVDSDGVVIAKEQSDKYATYSNPVIMEDYIVVKATYDEDKTLGTLKADLIVFDEKGKKLHTLDTNSYFNNLIVDGKSIITERIYVDGVCTTSKGTPYKENKVVTYNVWDVDSCNTYHYFEKYEIEKQSLSLGETIIDEIVNSGDEDKKEPNPDTEVFPIVLFVIISICLVFVIYISLKKSQELR